MNFQEKYTLNVDLFLNRLKSVLNIQTDNDLSIFLKVTPQTISNWRKRKSPKYEIIITKCLQQNVDFNYLMKGIAPDEQTPYKRELNQTIAGESKSSFKINDTYMEEEINKLNRVIVRLVKRNDTLESELENLQSTIIKNKN
ncbi:MAG: helix-turn-helix domain-containing protein [Bacteroidales bacterium]|nr:helix-turn-helix domain-containing protein [Bacteroidales bacterium]